MGNDWKVLVRLHNLVNIPREVLVESGPNGVRVFSVVVRAVGSDGSLLTDCAEVCAEFTTRNILRTSVNNNELLEVRLDGPGGSNTPAPAAAFTTTTTTTTSTSASEWSTRSPTLELLVIVKEKRPTGVRVAGTCSSSLVIDVAYVVQNRKLVTHIVGTEMGQVGLSLAVAHSDLAGYRRRLVEFLSHHNPNGLHLVDKVVGSIPEVDTFTKLYRKYNIIDYEQRVRAFFRLYGREHIDRVTSLLREWENREEELMHNLVLDNGPEPDTIPTETRFDAFLKAHRVTSATPDVARAVRELGDTPRKLFAALTQIFGPEPDPRSYLFPPTHYEAMQPQQECDLELVPALCAGRSSQEPQGVAQADGAHRLLEDKSQLQQRPPTIPGDSHVINSSVLDSNRRHHHHQNSNNSNAAKSNTIVYDNNSQNDTSSHKGGSSLWDAFCESLLRRGQQPSDVFYMGETVLSSVIENVGHTRSERDVLLHQWHQRLRAAVREETLSPGDAYYDTAMKEVLDVVGLQQLNLEVSTMTRVDNREHASGFALRLDAARQRATERLAVIGDYDKLHSIVLHGVGGDPTSQGSPCAVFYRKPFKNWNRKQATCILVCDVVIGKPFVSPPQVKTSCEANEEFRREWDCCVFHELVGGMALAVYDPKQVLPRYMLQCHVDTTVTPCPVHTSRAVEYYVIDENVFACSRCVVLGSYRGKEVLTIDDAAAQARSRLSDYEREAQQLITDVEARSVELSREVNEMKTTPKRLAAEREVERIRREAEERVAAVLRALEQEEHEHLAEIRLRQAYVAKAREAACALVEQVKADLQHGSDLQVVAALRRVQAGAELEYLKTEFQRSGGVYNHHDANSTPGTDNFVAHDNSSNNNNNNDGNSSHHYNRYGNSAALSHSVTESQSIPGDSATGTLYAKYLALASGNEGREDSRPLNIGSRKNKKDRSENRAPSAAHSDRACRAKEDVTKGWALYSQGDREGARRVWNDVHERHTDDAVGARARAYIAEAVERDYEAAARWYDISLQRDPADAMTLYNYGVLLEALLGRRREALVLFERAHALGDSSAGRRAQQLRVSLEMP